MANIKVRTSQSTAHRPSSPAYVPPKAGGGMASLVIGAIAWTGTVIGIIACILIIRDNGRRMAILEQAHASRIAAATEELKVAKATAFAERQENDAQLDDATKRLADLTKDLAAAEAADKQAQKALADRSSAASAAAAERARQAVAVDEAATVGAATVAPPVGVVGDPPMTPWGLFPELQVKLEFARWQELQSRDALAAAQADELRRGQAIDGALLKVKASQSNAIVRRFEGERSKRYSKYFRNFECSVRNNGRDTIKGVRIDFFAVGKYKAPIRDAENHIKTRKTAYVMYLNFTKTVDLDAGESREIQIPEILTGGDRGEDLGGAEYETYICVVTDPNDDVLFTSSARPAFATNPKALRDFKRGARFTKDAEPIDDIDMAE